MKNGKALSTAIWNRHSRLFTGAMLFLAGCLFLVIGIQREEYKTVEQKSNIICLECIGIG